jgi:hypothetical protein
VRKTSWKRVKEKEMMRVTSNEYGERRFIPTRRQVYIDHEDHDDDDGSTA